MGEREWLCLTMIDCADIAREMRQAGNIAKQKVDTVGT